MTRWAAMLALALVGCAAGPRHRPVIENRSEPADARGRSSFHGPITEAGLVSLMEARFARQRAAGTFVAEFNGTLPDLLAELEAMGIDDLGQLARLIPPDYDRRAADDFTADSPANIPGVLRDVFIIHDARRYFRDAWKNHWQSLAENNLPMYRHYGVDLGILRTAGVLPEQVTPSFASSPPPPPPPPPPLHPATP